MTITEFLEARIAEDEAAANMRGDGSHSIHVFDIVGTYNPHCPDCRGLPGTTRVLAECAAKRAIITEHGASEVASLDRGTRGRMFLVCRVCAVGSRQVVAPCPTLRALAAIYKDHPDYQQEWAL